MNELSMMNKIVKAILWYYNLKKKKKNLLKRDEEKSQSNFIFKDCGI